MFTIEKAVRRGTPALISLWGLSGSGKTMSALYIARGLVGPKGKIGVVDTENRRALFYADLVGGWDHLDLQPPFTPERYRAAFETFEKAGHYDCVIVDSMSHVWEGEGGVLDMADKGTTKDGRALQGLKKWQAPKMEYKRLINALIRAPYHVIFCLRAKEKVLQQPDGTIASQGLVPISEKNFVYEMTVDARLDKISHVPDDIKCPADLLEAFPRGKPITVNTGERIVEWINGAAPFDMDAEQIRRVARDVATMGTVRFREHWATLDRGARAALKPITAELQSIATDADREVAGKIDTPTDDPLVDHPAENGAGSEQRFES